MFVFGFEFDYSSLSHLSELIQTDSTKFSLFVICPCFFEDAKETFTVIDQRGVYAVLGYNFGFLVYQSPFSCHPKSLYKLRRARKLKLLENVHPT